MPRPAGRLVNLGSLCIDNVYATPNIAASGETVASRNHAVHPGGKGLNQSLAAARAGADVAHVGCIGADGGWLREELAAAGVDVSAVREVESPTGHAVIQVTPRGENAIVIAGGANRLLTGEDVDAAFSRCGPDDWLLLQNEINDLPCVLARAREADTRVAFNVAPVDGRERDYDLAAIDLLIVNEVEAAALAAETEPAAAMSALCERYPECDVVLTLGRDGLRYRCGERRAELEAFRVEAVDETAAGDAFVGYLLAALLEGCDFPEAVRRGAAAGALAVTRPGAASSIPERDGVLALAAKTPKEASEPVSAR